MKTNNLQKKSFLMTMILALSSGFNSIRSGGHGAPMDGGGEAHYHSHGSFHKTGMLKGWQKENRRSTFNKNR
jgi:hypothetical protein